MSIRYGTGRSLDEMADSLASDLVTIVKKGKNPAKRPGFKNREIVGIPSKEQAKIIAQGIRNSGGEALIRYDDKTDTFAVKAVMKGGSSMSATLSAGY
jgi:hypothetical protein